MAAQRTGFWFLFKGVDQTGCGPRDETGLLRTLLLKVKLGEVSASHAGELHVGAAQTGSGLVVLELGWQTGSCERREAAPARRKQTGTPDLVRFLSQTAVTVHELQLISELDHRTGNSQTRAAPESGLQQF